LLPCASSSSHAATVTEVLAEEPRGGTLIEPGNVGEYHVLSGRIASRM
jgi:hypothetical protein